MKELVMTIEMKEVDVMNPQMAGDVGYAFANMADMLMNVRMQMYAPPMTFDEYVDELQRISGFVEIEDYGMAMKMMCDLAEKIDPNLSIILGAYVVHDDNVIVPFLNCICEKITATYLVCRS